VKILGTKCWGQESAIFYLDTTNRTIFAVNSDRISRIKKDNYDISPILNMYSKQFSELEVIAIPFKNYNGRDALLETKGTSYFWLNYQRLRRGILKPKYYSDLTKKLDILSTFKLLLGIFSRPKIIYYYLIRQFYWNKYIDEKLSENFHFKYCFSYIKELFEKYEISERKINFYDHHHSHAASAFYFSKFSLQPKSKTIIFTLDEHGDNSFSSLAVFENMNYRLLAKSTADKFYIGSSVYVTSIASIYSSFTHSMGFRRSSDEGKVEALAAFGNPNNELLMELNKAIYIEDMEFKCNLNNYYKLCNPEILDAWRDQIGGENFCSTVQTWLEDIVCEYLNLAHTIYGGENLCIAGGVAANVIMNYRIYERTPYKNIFVVPFMGDEGSAVGAAILAAVELQQDISWLSNFSMPYWGPEFNSEEILAAAQKFPNITLEGPIQDWPLSAAKSIYENKIVAVFQGRMEFGPRALGNRSILANPLDADMRKKMNASIKKRPWFQPFCPIVLEEDRERLFHNSYHHKHMATAFLMREEFRRALPSAIHVDGTARPQFVTLEDNPNIYKFLKELKNLSGYGVAINTSFNLHGRTIVNTPEDAITDFLDCDIDELYIGGFRVERKKK
jgi:carbamoyltransferase